MVWPINKAIGFHANKCVLPISLVEQSRKEENGHLFKKGGKERILSVEMCSQISQVLRTGSNKIKLEIL